MKEFFHQWLAVLAFFVVAFGPVGVGLAVGFYLNPFVGVAVGAVLLSAGIAFLATWSW